ncbi:hypothetical protein [Mesorhizobium sp. STM 4661]|uniref:hypothetical protein n=1 Tax=Mesorhizobium sp. STM 4661 TaxID=1297570 RepID=UPI0002C01922|nr:hypothetical protein [Mesorhizobium sp. STM 4661]CCV15030.1 exported hypothetical protein [Mesorhizobium sp. STM 4661]
MIGVLAVWSLLAWVGYALVDPVLSWLAGTAGSGQGVVAVVDSLNVGGVLGQAKALLRIVVKPAIVVLWAIGALVLIAAPLILPRIGRLLSRLRR